MSGEQQENVFASEDVANHKAHALCAYLHIIIGLPLFLVPLIAAPNSRFARFHGDQGLTHFLVIVVGSVVLMIIPILGWLLLFPFFIVMIILGILGIINVAKGQGKRLPLIGRWTIIGPKNSPKEPA